MSLQTEVMDAIKIAMKAKDAGALAALRAVKSELLLASTSASSSDFTEQMKLKSFKN